MNDEFDEFEYRCCVCKEIVLPDDDDTLIDSDGNMYCDLHSRFCEKFEDEELD